MSSPKRLCIHLRSRPLDTVRLLLPLLLGAVLLWPWQALAAFRSPDADDNTKWNTAAGWSNIAGGAGNSSQPGVGANVILENSASLACNLDLGSAPLNTIGNLSVQSGNWGITGDNTLVTSGPLQVNGGGTFVIQGGADLTVNGNSNIIGGSLELAKAALTITGGLSIGNITTPGQYRDTDESIVTVGGRTNINDDITLGGTVINSGQFETAGLTTKTGADLTLSNTARLDTGTAVNNINSTLTLKDGAEMTGTGQTNVRNSGALKLEGASSFAGGALTITPGSSFVDSADSTVALTGAATFDSNTSIKSKSFTSDGLRVSAGGLKVDDGATVNADVKGALRANGNIWIANYLELGAGSELKGYDLYVGGAYDDTTFGEGNNSVALTGRATFGSSDTKIYNTFTSEGITTAGDLTIGNNGTRAAEVNTGAADRSITGSLTVQDGAQLLGSGNTYANNVALGANSQLAGRDLDVGGVYSDDPGSRINLNGAAIFRNDSTIKSTQFIAGSLAVAASKTLTLNNGANIVLNDAGGSILDGAIDLQGNSRLNGTAITFKGGYADNRDSAVHLSNKAAFTNNAANDIRGTFTASGLDITGTGTAVSVKETATFNPGNLYIYSGDPALPNKLDVATTLPLNLNNVTLEAYSALYGGDLTVHGSYKQDAGSVVDLDGMANFYGSVNVNNIDGSFSSQGMTIGNGTAPATVSLATVGALDLKGGDLIINRGGQLDAKGDLNLGNSRVNIDLNRDPTNPALVAAGQMTFGNNALTLRYSGATPQSTTRWTLVEYGSRGGTGGTDGAGGFDPLLTIATASLQGVLAQNATNIFFTGSYTPLSAANLAYLAAAHPNARRAAPGFADTFNNRRTPYMDHMDKAYNNMDALEADVAHNLQGMTAEAALNHAAQTQRAHIEIANAALAYALGDNAPLSAQGFVPSLQASLMQMGQQANPFQAQQRRGLMAARQRLGSAGLDGIPAQRQYSVLGNWQPASQKARQLVAPATPGALIAGMAAGSYGIPGVRVWGGYVGNTVNQQKKDGYSGYKANQNGLLVGASVDVAPVLTVGAYGGWTAGQYSAQGVKSDIDSSSVHLGGFFRFKGQNELQGFLVTGDVAYSSTSNDSTRTVPLQAGSQKMDASYGQYVIGGGLEVAYDYVPPGDEYTRVTPFVAGRYSHLYQNGYTESGNLSLKVGDINNDQYTTTVGLRVARDFVIADDSVVITPRASAAWLRNWGKDRLTARSSFVGSPVSFDTKTASQDRDAAQLGAGIDLRVKQNSNWDFGLKAAYGLDLRASSTGHNFFGGVELNF